MRGQGPSPAASALKRFRVEALLPPRAPDKRTVNLEFGPGGRPKQGSTPGWVLRSSSTCFACLLERIKA